MCLADAIADLKGEVLRGQAAEPLVDDVAAEYGLNPKLLLRKFRESYPTDEGIRATHAGTRADAIFEAKLKAKVEELCRYYRISETDVKRAQFMGKTYTVIGALTSSTALAVSHVDCRSYRLRPGSKHNLRFL